MTLINWLLKPKCFLIHIFWIFVVWKYDMIFVFWDTWPYEWKQNILFYYYLNVLTKTGYFNTGFVSLQYKNKNQYWSKWSKKFAENHRFFEKNFFEFFFIFWLGPTRPMWLDWTHATWSLAQAGDPTKPFTRKILRVNGTVRR